MKKNKFWFTFIELVVVISILLLISGYTITSFSKNLDSQSLLSEVNLINIKTSWLDKDIWKEITDYSLYLQTGSFYYYTTNNYYRDILNEISFLWWTWTLKINHTWIETLTNNVKILFKNKILSENNLFLTWTLQLDVSQIWNYYIKTQNEKWTLNDIFINYFSQINEDRQINLASIIDEDNNSYTWIVIKNWLGQTKEFYDFSWNKIDKKIILTFENENTQTNLELTK